ncbi:MAG TPA: preprotein translocase subunit YajC [Nitrospiria bacterium]
MQMFSSTAWAQEPGAANGGPAAGGGGFIFIFQFVIIVLLFYFLLILPNQRRQKKHKAMLAALKKGDRILTTGGILGAVMAVTKEIITIQIADNVRIKVRREYIAELVTEPEETA